MGRHWGAFGSDSEWATLRAVLLHAPGEELEGVEDPDAVQMLALPDPTPARQQHAALAAAYRAAGVAVHRVEPDDLPPPNLMFVADLLFMTPEGAILGRPASEIRAGEERYVARALANLGIPILRSVRGQGTFEGADALWVDEHTVLLATGLRTNPEGADQVAALLHEMGVTVLRVGLPQGAMHLMGCLRIVARDLAIAWPGRIPFAAVSALLERGMEVRYLPDEAEASEGQALNVVNLAPRSVLMAAGNPVTEAFYESIGLAVTPVRIDELARAAGGIACLTGILARDDPPPASA